MDQRWIQQQGQVCTIGWLVMLAVEIGWLMQMHDLTAITRAGEDSMIQIDFEFDQALSRLIYKIRQL